jgi:hypothetical protein
MDSSPGGRDAVDAKSVGENVLDGLKGPPLGLFNPDRLVAGFSRALATIGVLKWILVILAVGCVARADDDAFDLAAWERTEALRDAGENRAAADLFRTGIRR